jgi:hypothetical protein
MSAKTNEIEDKLLRLERMITEEELYILQKEYERRLGLEQKRKVQRKNEILRLFGMIDFLGFWAMVKRDRKV